MALRWCLCIVSVIIVVYVDPSIEEPTVKPLKSPSPPYFRKQQNPIQIYITGENIKLRCRVKGHPKPFLHWFRDTQLIDHLTDPRIKVKRYALVIENAQINDTGKYHCRVENQHGLIWGNFTVIVTNSSDITDIIDIEDDNDEVIHEQREATMPGKPKWSSKKPDYEIIARPAYSYVEMHCQAFGLPKPKIKWLFNGQSFERSVEGQWYMKGYKLILGDLVPKDSGNYTCIVSNNFGSINWTYMLLVVPHLPRDPVIDGPKNQTVAVGEDAVFNCRVVLSEPHPHLQWLQHYKVNGSYTTPEGDPYVTVLQTSSMNISKPGQLILRNVTADMAGWYTCVVQNSIGIEYGSACLTVIDENPVTPDMIRTNTTASHGISTTIPLIAGGSAASLLIMLLVGIFIFVWFRKKKHLSMPCNTRITKQEPTSV